MTIKGYSRSSEMSWFDGVHMISYYRSIVTMLLVWCLECDEVNTSPRLLKIYTGYLLLSE